VSGRLRGSSAWLLVAAAAWSAAADARTVAVGSKNFNESYLLAEMAWTCAAASAWVAR
jgi:glycine betaine/choline ABC-type transport system substrate-binding protein